MNRILYSWFLLLLAPFVLLRLFWKSIKTPLYRYRIKERFGYTLDLSKHDFVIWIQAVSVGESIASFPLVKALCQCYPLAKILITTTTVTGSNHVKKMYRSELNRTIYHCYFPYDLMNVQRRFLRRIQPKIAIMIDTELWPNSIALCRNLSVPVMIVNARLSERSELSYARFPTVINEMISNISRLVCQSSADAQRFIQLGANENQVVISGSVKFDISIDEKIQHKGLMLKQAWIKRVGNSLKILVGASTHEGEEKILLKVFSQLKKHHPKLVLILVPRHPERFASVFQQACQDYLDDVVYYSQLTEKMDSSIVIGDVMGQLMMFYAMADIAFVGGSLVEVGGHNMLEPAALGVPILTGKYLYNFQSISDSLREAGGMSIVKNEQELYQIAHDLLIDERVRHIMGDKALNFVLSNRGAVKKTLQLIDSQLSK